MTSHQTYNHQLRLADRSDAPSHRDGAGQRTGIRRHGVIEASATSRAKMQARLGSHGAEVELLRIL
jgi:hypothetical protein